MAAQALRRYVSTPLGNLGCLAMSVHLQRWPRQYGGYVPATSAAKDVTLQGRIAFFDHDLVGFGALPFLAADRAKTSRGGILEPQNLFGRKHAPAPLFLDLSCGAVESQSFSRCRAEALATNSDRLARLLKK